MTIFGFNTDVKLGDVVYHVQSEARQSDFLLQTLVFVKGQCVGKRAVSYAQRTSEAGFSEQAMHELLKAQHKKVIDAIQQDRLPSVLGATEEIQDVGGEGLSLRLTGTTPHHAGSAISANFEVLDSGAPAAGAKIVIAPLSPNDAPAIASATADHEGKAQLVIPLTAEVLRDYAVMIRAAHGGKSATRKIRFKK